MGLIPRVLIEAGQVKVSKPGISVLEATNDDLLLSITQRPAQFLMIGQVYVRAYQQKTIPYGLTLPSRPIILFQFSKGGLYNIDLPYWDDGSEGNKVQITSGTSSMIVRELDGSARIVNYRVIKPF